MQKKKCSKCQTEKNADSEHFYSSKRDGFIQPCIDCIKVRCKLLYQNDENYRTRRANRKVRIRNASREFVREYLKTHPCVDCGEGDFIVLQFDHDDPSSKRYDIANMVTNAWKLEAIKREIEKCSVRCANCHTRKTARQRGYWKTENA
jgi:hypothetical protein